VGHDLGTTTLDPHELMEETGGVAKTEGVGRDSLARNAGLAAIALAAVCALTYGITLSSLGFYWDDWPGMTVTSSLGWQGIQDYVGSDRPATAWLFAVTAPLLGTVPARAHAGALVLRWALACAVWWIVIGIWPGHFLEAGMVSCLFAVYPGFTGHSVAWIHLQGIYIPMLFSLGSLACMVWSTRSSKPYLLSFAGVVGSIVSIVFIEYFVGLELLRVPLLWVLEDRPHFDLRLRFRRVMTRWLPYAGVLFTWTIWRMFLFHSTRAVTDQFAVAHSIATNPLRQLSVRIFQAGSDLLECGVMVWSQTIGPYLLHSHTPHVWLIGLVILLLGAILTTIFLRYLGPGAENSSNFSRCAVVIGITAMLLGGVPVWAVNRGVVLGQLSDRYSTPLMLGACILLTGVITAIVKDRRYAIAVVALLVGSSAAFQYRNQDAWAADWSLQKDFFRQLSWRAPSIAPGTALLLVDESKLNPKSDYALSIPLNLVYSGKPSTPNFNYWLFRVSAHGDEGMQPPAETATLAANVRTLHFHGDATHAIAAWLPASGCLKILSDDSLTPFTPGIAQLVTKLSHTERIGIASQASVPSAIFGTPPPPSWCFFYERAALASQLGDWRRVASIADEVRETGLLPEDPAEWFPFLEGYIHTHRHREANALAELLTRQLPNWSRLENAKKDIAAALIEHPKASAVSP
jgi:hypothetical protein